MYTMATVINTDSLRALPGVSSVNAQVACSGTTTLVNVSVHMERDASALPVLDYFGEAYMHNYRVRRSSDHFGTVYEVRDASNPSNVHVRVLCR
jgi:hypothetical protein